MEKIQTKFLKKAKKVDIKHKKIKKNRNKK